MSDDNSFAPPAPATAAAAVPVAAADAHGAPPLGWVLRRTFGQPRFLLIVAILGVAAVGLNAAASFLQLHFRKQAVPLPVPGLQDEKLGIPAAFGRAPGRDEVPWWVQVSRDEPMAEDVEHILGTKEHVFRDYVNVAALLQLRFSSEPKEQNLAAALWGEGSYKAGPLDTLRRSDTPQKLVEFLAALRGRPTEDRNRFLFQMNQVAPSTVVRMAVTYYTGMVDTVAHVPDRCYVADGFEPTSPAVKSVQCGTFADGTPRVVPYRFIFFDDQSGLARGPRYVGYLFHVNGEYAKDGSPIDVRQHLQVLSERYAYYAKVEMMTGGDAKDPSAEAGATAAMNDFLRAAMPEIEARLPDWKRLKAGGK